MTPSATVHPGRTASALRHARRRAKRLAALPAEMARLGGAPTGATRTQLKRWHERTVEHRAPYAIIRQPKAARYRLPRRLKQQMIDRFCAGEERIASLRAAIVVAHQDDESIGAGSRLCRLSDAHVVHVTDGAPANPEVLRRHGFATRDQYAEARQEEVLRALALAGVPPERIICLGLADGEAAFRLVDICLRLTELFDDWRPHIVVTHPYEGGHTDHDATAFAVHLACGLLHREGIRPPAVLELASYYARNGKRVVQDFVPHARADHDRHLIRLEEEDRELKRRMFACFGTQREVLREFDPTIENFRPAPRYNFIRPPHPGVLNYERYGDPRLGERWRLEAAHALDALGVRRFD